jgi:hypothetical protein
MNNNELLREDFINSVDSKKIWSKQMTLSEVYNMLNGLEKTISIHNFVSDKNFLMEGRRTILKESIDKRISNNNDNLTEMVLDSLFNFWEFVNNEYFTANLESVERLHLCRIEIENMCTNYTRKGIICLEEKDVILEMIQKIKKIIESSNM